jgi:hypothetical protein
MKFSQFLRKNNHVETYTEKDVTMFLLFDCDMACLSTNTDRGEKLCRLFFLQETTHFKMMKEVCE